MAKVSIQFIRSCSPYNEGDQAGFDQRIAEKYIRNGSARYVTTAVDAAPVVKAPEPEPVVEPSPPAPEPVEEKPVIKKKKKKKVRPRRREE